MLMNGATSDGRVNGVEQIDCKFVIGCTCMQGYITICGGMNGGALLESNGVGIWVVFGVELLQVDCCSLNGVSKGTHNIFIKIPDVGAYTLVEVVVRLVLVMTGLRDDIGQTWLCIVLLVPLSPSFAIIGVLQLRLLVPMSQQSDDAKDMILSLWDDINDSVVWALEEI